MKFLYICIIYILFLILTKINGELIFKDITFKQNAYTKYSKNKVDCDFDELYFVIQNTETPTNAQFVLNSSNSNFIKFDQKTNDNTYTYKVAFSRMPMGISVVYISGSEGVFTKYLALNLNCIQLDDDLIDSEYISPMGVNVFGSIGYFVKLKDIQYNPHIYISTTNGDVEKIGNCIYYYTKKISNSVKPDNTISFNYGTTTVTQNNYYPNDNVENVNDFKYLLNYTTDIVLMGDLAAPLFSFKSTTQYYIPPYLTTTAQVFQFYNIKLVSTRGIEKTFIGFFDYTSKEGEKATYDFFIQNNIGFVSTSTTDLKITGKKFDLLPINGNFTQSGDLVAINFEEKSYHYSTIYLRYNEASRMTMFPFGFKNGSNDKGYSYDVTMILPTSFWGTSNIYVECDSGNSPYSTLTKTGFKSSDLSSLLPVLQSELPIFESYEFGHLHDFQYVLRMNISCKHYIYKIQINDLIFNDGSLSVVSATGFGGIYEFVLNLFSPNLKIIVNDYGLRNGVVSNDIFSLQTLKPFLVPQIDPDFNFLDIKNVSILFKTLNVTNQIAGNILYFNYSTIDRKTPIALVVNSPLFPSQGGGMFDKLFYASYNNSIQLFQVEFWLPKNSQPGNIIPFALFFKDDVWVSNNEMGPDAQFSVISNNADLQGPIITKIEKFPETNGINIIDVNGAVIGWNVEIQDETNGIKNLTIIVRGSVDGSTYYFKFEAEDLGNSTTKIIQKKIKIYAVSNCVSQDYIITDVILYDSEDNNSTFSTYSYKKSIVESSLYNPFINFLNDPTINQISVICFNQRDPSPPIITSLNFENIGIDVGNLNRNFNLIIEVSDLESGLKSNHNPTIYLSSIGSDFITCPITNNQIIGNTSSEYYCETKLPIGFGYPYGIFISVYGLVNNGGYYGGYSNQDLLKLFPSSKVGTTFGRDVPVITGWGSISTLGGNLWVYGKGFGLATNVFIKDMGVVAITNRFGDVALQIFIPPVNEGFKIYIDQFINNTYLIIPFKKVDIPQLPTTPTPTSTPTPTLTESPTPLITNPPQKCLGNPICGGADKGKCNEKSGCVCFSPFVGVDCGGRVIIVPTPSINLTNPSTEIPVVDDEGGETSNYLFKSLISIISLRELDFNSKVIKTFTFDRWIYTPISESSSNYFTNISTSENGGDSSECTNITVNLQWFKEKSVVNFANQDFSMQPSSMKYTIQISQYKFENQINQLQLVMMASLESKKTDSVCSALEFGETSSGDNSNYIKIQIDNKSLYGRFIKRAIIDSKVTSIGNIPLDSSLNPIKEASNVQSYIGITIPNFQQSITIDPDFSVLVDSKSVSLSDNNSICNSSGGLTKPQLAGIIVGSVAAFICLSIIGIVLFIKSRKHTLLLLKVKDIKMFQKK